jgi:hypothetical protein
VVIGENETFCDEEDLLRAGAKRKPAYRMCLGYQHRSPRHSQRHSRSLDRLHVSVRRKGGFGAATQRNFDVVVTAAKSLLQTPANDCSRSSRQQKSEFPEGSDKNRSVMGNFLYRRIQKCLLQTTRSKMMPKLPTRRSRCCKRLNGWAASNPHPAVGAQHKKARLAVWPPTTKLRSLDASWTPNRGSWSYWRL